MFKSSRKAGQVTRPNYVKARAFDENLEEYEIEGEGLLARAICHELDHLDGHMYVEKWKVRSTMYSMRIRKMRKTGKKSTKKHSYVSGN